MGKIRYFILVKNLPITFWFHQNEAFAYPLVTRHFTTNDKKRSINLPSDIEDNPNKIISNPQLLRILKISMNIFKKSAGFC